MGFNSGFKGLIVYSENQLKFYVLLTVPLDVVV